MKHTQNSLSGKVGKEDSIHEQNVCISALTPSVHFPAAALFIKRDLLENDSHTIQIMHLSCVIWWFLVFHFHFWLSCIGEGNGNPLQCSCLENPREGGAWWAAVCGVAQSRTRLKRLSSSSSIFTGWADITTINFTFSSPQTESQHPLALTPIFKLCRRIKGKKLPTVLLTSGSHY